MNHEGKWLLWQFTVAIKSWLRLARGFVGLMALFVVQTVRAESVDLGVVEAHRKIECGFAITNDSHVVWFVQGARSSCACLAVEVRQGELRAGEVLPVRVVFDPQGMEGAVEKSVWVELKSRTPVVRNFRADVRCRLGLKPSDAAFGVIRSADAGRTLEATLAGYATTNAMITDIISPTNAFFEVVVSAPSANLLTVRFAHSHPLPGTYAETWRIRTTDPDIPEIAFPVSARIADGFTVTPHALTIDAQVGAASRADRTVSRAVTLRRGDGKPFNVLFAETKPRKWGDVKIVQRPLGGWQVVIENIDPDVVRQFSKKPYLEIATNLTDLESVAIPLLTTNERK